MTFIPIDMQAYPRRGHYEHYTKTNPCTYSVTANVDITVLLQAVKSQKLKLYPTMIYIITKTVNMLDEFKMSVKDGMLGVYNTVSASYLIFHDDDKTFSCAYTKYQSEFTDFYNEITADMRKYKDTKGLVAIPAPENTFPVSCLPWLNYTGFNLNIPYSKNFYAPIITWGQYSIIDSKAQLPVTVQIDHAVADGYHTSLFFTKLQDIINDFRCTKPIIFQ